MKEVDENGWSTLHCAAYVGNMTIVRSFFKNSDKQIIYFGTKDENKTALHIAAMTIWIL